MSLYTYRYVAQEPRADTHPRDVYTVDMHERNRAAAADFLAVLGVAGTTERKLCWAPEGQRIISSATVISPWMISGDGLAKVVKIGATYRTKIVTSAEEIQNGILFEHGIDEHLVGHTIDLDEEGLVAQTKIYPPFFQELRFKSGLHLEGPSLMSYPTLNFDPARASKALQDYLDVPDQLPLATSEYIRSSAVHSLIARRPITARLRLGIKLPA